VSTVAVQNLGTLAFVPDAQKTVMFLNTDITLGFTSLDDGNYRATIPNTFTDTAGNAFAGNVLDFFVFAGDANRDRTIDIQDFAILGTNFNQPGTFSDGDFNYSGMTDINDFSILASKFNTSLPAARGAAVAPAAAPRMVFGRERIDLDEIEDVLPG
jgi:hypothetical protein